MALVYMQVVLAADLQVLRRQFAKISTRQSDSAAKSFVGCWECRHKPDLSTVCSRGERSAAHQSRTYKH